VVIVRSLETIRSDSGGADHTDGTTRFKLHGQKIALQNAIFFTLQRFVHLIFPVTG
jgi:hypothetical protein